jgi:hypothetical protein
LRTMLLATVYGTRCSHDIRAKNTITMQKYTLLALCLFLFLPTLSHAGGSPETTLVVVNADSPLSLTVANHYVQLRQIPENHVVWLHNIPSLGNVSIETFRKRIWGPIRQFMADHGLTDHIDTIAYSADFPYAIKLNADLSHNNLPIHHFSGVYASLTGLTFFYRQVEERRMDYLSFYPNGYYRRDLTNNLSSSRRLEPEEEKSLTEAHSNLRQRKYRLAHDTYLELNNKYPKRSQLLLGLTESLAGLKRYNQALDSLERLAAIGFRSTLLLRNSPHLKGIHKTRTFLQITRKMDEPSSRFELPHGFHSRYHWSRNSLSMSLSSFDRYYLSSMLAYTGQRGNSLDEIRRYLDRAASSDATRPTGTVYLMENNDIRTEARQPWFSETCKQLEQIGRKCQIISNGNRNENGILPMNRDDIIGLATGIRSFDWGASGSSLLPGAIADSFTSWGGSFNNTRQTKLTEFLRHGAAGSSGAVQEPYDFPQKFPLPLIHYYYASGCSLAESWYQSVASPYQMILVGDPITRPFAHFADIEQISPDPNKIWSGSVQIKTKIRTRGKSNIARVELWVDGVPVSNSAPGNTLIWDTFSVEDGYHDVRLVAEETGLIRTRSFIRHDVTILNHNSHKFTIQSKNLNTVYHEKILLNGTGQNASLIEIYQGRRKLGETRVSNGIWGLQIPTEPLGMGVTNVTALSTTEDGRKVRSSPITLNISPPTTIPNVNEQVEHYPGLVSSIKYVDQTFEQKRINRLDGQLINLARKGTPVESIKIEGEFKVDHSGFYQIVASTKGEIELVINSVKFRKVAPNNKYGLVYIPISLSSGWHRISINPSPEGLEKLTLLLSGSQAPVLLGGDEVRNTILIDNQ